MTAVRSFPDRVLAVLEKGQGLRLRAGAGDHRFVGLWFVLVEGRLLVRSWSVRRDGWYRTLTREPEGMVRLGNLEIAVRALPVRNKRLRDAADRAYLEKYNTPGALKYARDLGSPKSRATTTELVPLANRG